VTLRQDYYDTIAFARDGRSRILFAVAQHLTTDPDGNHIAFAEAIDLGMAQ
jgi:hypothetical protein